MQIIATPKIDWIGRRLSFFAVSGGLVAASLGVIALRGFNYAIDFSGGTLVQIGYKKGKDLGSLRRDLGNTAFPDAQLQSLSGDRPTFAIRVKGATALDAQGLETLISALQAADPGSEIVVDKKEYVGPSVGRHLKRQALLALVFALLGIVVYVGFRFTNPLWGGAAIAALIHDVIGTAGLFALLQKEVDLVIVAALLAIAGYSVNDTIVIFDRMRERMRLFRREPFADTINASINEMMGRTLITNGCVLAVDLVLLFFGGPVLRDFATAMLAGAVLGTWSTVALATPLVYHWEMAGKAAPPPAPVPGAVPAGQSAPQGKKRR